MNIENVFQNKERGIYDIYIPSLERMFPFREINMSQQKRLAKSIITGDEIYCTEFLYTLLNIISENSVENITLEKLKISDILLIALGMRASSVGYKIKLNVVCNKCKAAHTINTDLQIIYDKLIKIDPMVITLETEDFKFKCELPSSEKEKIFLYDVKSIITKGENVVERFILLNVDRYVSEITNKNIAKKVEIKSIQDRCEFYKKLSIETFNQLLKTVENINNHIQSIILFDIKCVKECPAILMKRFSYDVEYFYEFLKLIFSEDLLALYKDIYYLQKIGIEPNYTEGLTAPERQLIWNYFLADEDSKKKYKSQLTAST